MAGEDLMRVEAALASVLARATPLEAESVPLAQAYGRTLAQDVASTRTQPPFDVSAMDGYALRAGDCAATSARLLVIGASTAGHSFAGSIGEGEAGHLEESVLVRSTMDDGPRHRLDRSVRDRPTFARQIDDTRYTTHDDRPLY